MAKKFEAAIKDWYDNSQRADLSYLDLATESKPTASQLAHNLQVIFDRLSLHSSVSIKEHYIVVSKLQTLEKSIEDLKSELTSVKKALTSIQKEVFSHKPLSAQEVHSLALSLIKEPKQIEQQAVHLLKELKEQTSKVETLIHEVNHYLTS
uniref:ORF1 n=1 Tax=Taro bacilliform virus TaxID=178354 RepID=A0A3B1EK14_9VIRU|nr:ORF1 [Taro bacilliform virus]